MCSNSSVPLFLTSLIKRQPDSDSESDTDNEEGTTIITQSTKYRTTSNNNNNDSNNQENSFNNANTSKLSQSSKPKTKSLKEANPNSNSFRYRTQYTKEEDEIIRSHVEKYGPRLWKKCKESLGGTRKPKQCRERWMNTLNPAINKSVWTSEEDNALEALHDQYGPKWTLIAKALGTNRTDNCVKNHWNSKHRRISGVKRQLPGTPLEQDSPPTLEIPSPAVKKSCGVDVICDVINNDEEDIGNDDSNGDDSECVSLNEVNELLMFIEAAGKDKKMVFSGLESPTDDPIDFDVVNIKGNGTENVKEESGETDGENGNNNSNNNPSDYWFPLNTF